MQLHDKKTCSDFCLHSRRPLCPRSPATTDSASRPSGCCPPPPPRSFALALPAGVFVETYGRAQEVSAGTGEDSPCCRRHRRPACVCRRALRAPSSPSMRATRPRVPLFRASQAASPHPSSPHRRIRRIHRRRPTRLRLRADHRLYRRCEPCAQGKREVSTRQRRRARGTPCAHLRFLAVPRRADYRLHQRRQPCAQDEREVHEAVVARGAREGGEDGGALGCLRVWS